MTEETLKKYIKTKKKIEIIKDYLEGETKSLTAQLKKDKVAQNEIRKPVEKEVINKITREEELEELEKEKEKLEKEIINFVKTLENPLQQKIIILKYILDHNTIEIAGELKVSKKTIINNLSKIRKNHLKK